MITTTCNVAPIVSQCFDSILLNRPAPDFRESCKTLWSVYLYLKKNLFIKAEKCPIRKAKLEKLEQEFLRIYGITQTKEKAIEEKTGKPAKEPFYWIGSVDRKNQEIFARIRFKS